MTEKTNRVELSLEELEAVNGGFWDDVVEFGKGLLHKVKDVLYRLKDWG